jgi:hypothetical protein
MTRMRVGRSSSRSSSSCSVTTWYVGRLVSSGYQVVAAAHHQPVCTCALTAAVEVHVTGPASLPCLQLDLKQVKEIMGRSVASPSGTPHLLDAPEGDIALIFSEQVGCNCTRVRQQGSWW